MDIVKFEFSLFGINTYAVVDRATKECVIVDPGMINDEERNAVDNFLSSNGLKLTGIINTHLHIDHVMGNKWVKENYGASVSGHKADAILGEHVDRQARMFGLAQEPGSVVLDRHLHDGDVIKVGEGELEVIHVPGHSPGSIALYDREDGFLISGDALFNGSIGRADLPGGDMAQLIDAIKSRLMVLPEDTLVYPGHGPATTIGREKRSNPFLI